MVDYCLNENIKFQKDYFYKTPLSYFLDSKSSEGVNKILQYASEKDQFEIIEDLDKDDLKKLFELSPSKLDSFLTASLRL